MNGVCEQSNALIGVLSVDNVSRFVSPLIQVCQERQSALSSQSPLYAYFTCCNRMPSVHLNVQSVCRLQPRQSVSGDAKQPSDSGTQYSLHRPEKALVQRLTCTTCRCTVSSLQMGCPDAHRTTFSGQPGRVVSSAFSPFHLIIVTFSPERFA